MSTVYASITKPDTKNRLALLQKRLFAPVVNAIEQNLVDCEDHLLVPEIRYHAPVLGTLVDTLAAFDTYPAIQFKWEVSASQFNDTMDTLEDIFDCRALLELGMVVPEAKDDEDSKYGLFAPLGGPGGKKGFQRSRYWAVYNGHTRWEIHWYATVSINEIIKGESVEVTAPFLCTVEVNLAPSKTIGMMHTEDDDETIVDVAERHLGGAMLSIPYNYIATPKIIDRSADPQPKIIDIEIVSAERED